MLRHYELDISVQMHASPDLDNAATTARYELDLLLVLGNGHLLLCVILLVAALLHEILRLDDDHASDVFEVGLFVIFGTRFILLRLHVGEVLLLHAGQRRVLNKHVVHELVPVDGSA